MALGISLADPLVTSLNLDESEGSQNATATPGVAGDADDHDIALNGTSIDSELYTMLFHADWMNLSDAFPDGGRVARCDNLLKVAADNTIGDISLGGAIVGGVATPLPVFDATDATTSLAAGLDSGWDTTDGEDIFLFGEFLGAGQTEGWAEQAGLAGDIVFGVDANGELAFVLLMDEADGTSGTEKLLGFTMLSFQPIADLDPDDPDDFIDLAGNLSIVIEQTGGFDFLNVPPNKVNYLHAPSSAEGDDGGLLIHSTTNVSQINTSNVTEFTVGWGSQGINSGETVVLSYADVVDPNLALPNLSGRDAKDPTTINVGDFSSETGAEFTIVQAVGNKTHSLQVMAFGVNNENDGAAYYDGFADDSLVDVNYIRVDFAGGGFMEFALDPTGPLVKTDPTTGTTIEFVRIDIDTITDVDFTIGDNAGTDTSVGGDDVWVARVLNVAQGDRVLFETDGVHQRSWVTGLSGNFDIGRLSTLSVTQEAADIGQYIHLEDAGPSISHSALATPDLSGVTVELDESIGVPDPISTIPDPDETSDNNSNADDTTNTTPTYSTSPDGFDLPGPTAATEAIGELRTAAGSIAGLFNSPTVEFDTDEEGSLNSNTGRTDTLSFVLTGDGSTNLVATPLTGTGSGIDAMSATERAIWLSVSTDGTVVEARIAGTGNDDDYVILRGTIVNATDPSTAFIVWEQFAPVVHDDNTRYDELKELLLGSGGSLAVKWDIEAEDGDGDKVTKSASVTLIDDTNSVLGIDDDGPGGDSLNDIQIQEGDLSWGNDLDDSKPLDDNSTNTTNFANLLFATADAGIEGGAVFSLSNATADLQALQTANAGLTHDGKAVKFHVDTTNNKIVGYVDAAEGVQNVFEAGTDIEVFEFTLSSTGSGTFTLKNYIDHAAGDGQNSKLIKLGAVVVVADVEGDRFRVDDEISYDVQDDVPLLSVENLVGTGTEATQIGQWSGPVGADRDPVTALTLDSWTINGVTGTGSKTVTPDATDPWAWRVEITDDFDADAATPDTTLKYDIAFDPLTGTYTVELVEGFGSTVSSRKTADGSLDAGGPDLARTVSFADAPDIVFFAVNDEAEYIDDIKDFLADDEDDGDGNEEEADVQALEGTLEGSFLAPGAKLNASTAGFGNGSNNFDAGQSFVVNPINDDTVKMNIYLSAKTVGGYDPGPEEITYTIYYQDGSAPKTVSVAAGDIERVTDADSPLNGQDFFTVEDNGKLIDAVQVTMVAGKVKIVEVEVFSVEESVANPVSTDLTLRLTDDDGDTESSGFSVDFETDPLLDPGQPDFILADHETGMTDDQPDNFNVDLNDPDAVLWAIDGFDSGVDTIRFIGASGAEPTLTVDANADGDDQIVVDGVTVLVRNGTGTIDGDDWVLVT